MVLLDLQQTWQTMTNRAMLSRGKPWKTVANREKQCLNVANRGKYGRCFSISPYFWLLVNVLYFKKGKKMMVTLMVIKEDVTAATLLVVLRLVLGTVLKIFLSFSWYIIVIVANFTYVQGKKNLSSYLYLQKRIDLRLSLL